MSRARILAIAVALLAAAVPSRTVAQERRTGFPHDEHAGLFPLCATCHRMGADPAAWYPAPAQCTQCHDGEREATVSWTAPAPRATLLDFSHVEHAREAETEGLSCESCHAPGGRARMEVVRAEPAQCISCHAHEASAHLVDARCETCHVPLASSTLAAERIATLPVPPDHGEADFLFDHAGAADCQVCHTRERCASCHVDAATNADIAAMPVAPASLELPLWAAHYPEPPSHTSPDWIGQHSEAASMARCSTCHTRSDCTSCHVNSTPPAVEALPASAEVQAPGVQVARMPPASHAIPSFEHDHDVDASTSGTSCTVCHARTDCAACHDAPARARFHPFDFAQRHASAAYARRLECANCHDTDSFCAECHQSTGRTASQNRGALYHDAQSVWLLRHGQAARQGLESCTSCHRQQDCLRCHSDLGAFRVNPHGRDFDARRAAARNLSVCRLCHLSDPVG